MGNQPSKRDELDMRDPAEADRIRDEALRRALAMPPKSLEAVKAEKPRRRAGAKESNRCVDRRQQR
jgi:hypothetical protein